MSDHGEQDNTRWEKIGKPLGFVTAAGMLTAIGFMAVRARRPEDADLAMEADVAVNSVDDDPSVSE